MPLPQECFLNNVEIEGVESYIDSLFLFLLQEKIWVLFISIDYSVTIDFDCIEERSLSKNKNTKDMEISKPPVKYNAQLGGYKTSKKRVGLFSLKWLSIEDAPKKTHYGFDIDVF